MPNIRPNYALETRGVSPDRAGGGKEIVRNAPRRAVVAGAAGGVLAGLLLLFLVVPVAGVVGVDGVAGARLLVSDAELRDAIARTAVTATTATLVAALTGIPLAWLLAHRAFRGRHVVELLLDLPLVLPHPVAGIALLLAFGRTSAVGARLAEAGLHVVGTPVGTVCAMLFVSAPLFVSAARESFARIDPSLELVARTLGEDAWGAFRRVTLPLARRGLLAGAVVTWARAVSEFGAVVVLAYNPKVVSVLSYERLTGFGLREALPVAAALLLVSLVPLAALRALRTPRRGWDAVALR